MVTLLLLAAVSIFAAWAFAYTQAKDQAKYVARLHDEHSRERELWHRERSELLNRIKPETAQYVPVPGPVHAPAAVGFDDDQDFWDSKDPLADMSTSELAEKLMAQELEERDGVTG
jgi:hypothetical protein